MGILAAYYFFTYLAMSVFIPYRSLYFSETGFDTTSVGLILSLWAFISVIAQPVMGVINDRIGNPRKLIMLSVAAAPIIGLGFRYAGHYAAVIALSVLFAWFQSSAGPISDSITADIGSRAGFSFTSIRLWGALSYAIGTFGTGFLYEQYGYDLIFEYYLIASVPVFALLLGFPKSGRTSPHKATLFEQAKEVFGNSTFMAFLGVSLLLVMSTASNAAYLPIYYREMGFGSRFIGSAFAVAALIEVPMFWLAVKLSRMIGRFRLLSLAAAIFGLRCLILFMFHHPYLALGLQVLDGMSFAFATGTFVEVVGNYAKPNTKATYQTIFVAVSSGLGGIIGNSAGGIIVEYKGAPFLYLVLCLLCTAASCLFLVMQQGKFTRADVERAAG